jgi:hypothetical protein
VGASFHLDCDQVKQTGKENVTRTNTATRRARKTDVVLLSQMRTENVSLSGDDELGSTSPVSLSLLEDDERGSGTRSIWSTIPWMKKPPINPHWDEKKKGKRTSV